MNAGRGPGRSGAASDDRRGPNVLEPPGGLVGGVQLDLFGRVDAELASAAQAQRAHAVFEQRTRFAPDGTAVQWVAPRDTVGARRGEVLPGWRCWLCGAVEGNEYVLQLRHGLDAADPGCLTWTTCTASTGGAAGEVAVSSTPSSAPSAATGGQVRLPGLRGRQR